MARTHWYDGLLTLLRDSPGEMETVTLTVTEVRAVGGQPLPPSAGTRSYWRNHGPGSMGSRLAAIGWRVAHVQRHDTFTLTFVRASADITV